MNCEIHKQNKAQQGGKNDRSIDGEIERVTVTDDGRTNDEFDGHNIINTAPVQCYRTKQGQNYSSKGKRTNIHNMSHSRSNKSINVEIGISDHQDYDAEGDYSPVGQHSRQSSAAMKPVLPFDFTFKHFRVCSK
jgi:hypothetical protein